MEDFIFWVKGVHKYGQPDSTENNCTGNQRPFLAPVSLSPTSLISTTPLLLAVPRRHQGSAVASLLLLMSSLCRSWVYTAASPSNIRQFVSPNYQLHGPADNGTSKYSLTSGCARIPITRLRSELQNQNIKYISAQCLMLALACPKHFFRKMYVLVNVRG